MAGPASESARFEVSARPQLLSILAALLKNSARLHLRRPDHDGAWTVRLVAIDDQHDTLTLAIADKPDATARATPPGAFWLEGALDQVTIRFECQPAEPPGETGAIVVHMPTRLFRMQRRESFRISTAATGDARCRLPAATAGAALCLQVRNISSGGLMLIDPATQLLAQVGSLLRGCTLELDGIAPIACDIEVKNIHGSGCGGERLIGVQFIALPPRSANSLQRYISRLEISRAAHARPDLA